MKSNLFTCFPYLGWLHSHSEVGLPKYCHLPTPSRLPFLTYDRSPCSMNLLKHTRAHTHLPGKNPVCSLPKTPWQFHSWISSLCLKSLKKQTNNKNHNSTCSWKLVVLLSPAVQQGKWKRSPVSSSQQPVSISRPLLCLFPASEPSSQPLTPQNGNLGDPKLKAVNSQTSWLKQGLFCFVIFPAAGTSL